MTVPRATGNSLTHSKEGKDLSVCLSTGLQPIADGFVCIAPQDHRDFVTQGASAGALPPSSSPPLLPIISDGAPVCAFLGLVCSTMHGLSPRLRGGSDGAAVRVRVLAAPHLCCRHGPTFGGWSTESVVNVRMAGVAELTTASRMQPTPCRVHDGVHHPDRWHNIPRRAGGAGLRALPPLQGLHEQVH